MGIPIHVDTRSATPIYDQVTTQVKHAVAAGVLAAGDVLPSVRQLAVTLRVNPNTVARAYRELESEGVVETRRGQGTFVAEGARRLPQSSRVKTIGSAVAALVADATRLDLALDDVIDAIKSAWPRAARRRSST